jgi:hypothetical protein
LWHLLRQATATPPTHDPKGGLSVEREITTRLAAAFLTGFSSVNLDFFMADFIFPWY